MYAPMYTLGSECHFGRHNFGADGACTRTGCKAKNTGVVSIDARRWFQRAYGNTYHSVSITMPDGRVLRVPMAYGYGSQYEQTALETIAVNVFGVTLSGDIGHSLQAFLAVRGMWAVIRLTDVSRKRDL